MIVPDYIEPITAYRVWQWDSFGLKSLNHTQWFPGQPLEAKCGNDSPPESLECEPVPGDGCCCGVYAAKDPKHLIELGYADFGICGEVSLWGKVVIHKLGYRAQFAYPKNLVIPSGFIPVPVALMESRIETLTAYGVPIQIMAYASSATDFNGLLDLWDKEKGFNFQAIDWLVHRANQPSPFNRKLVKGDRVAVPVKGIGIVTSIGDVAVELKMFGTEVVTAARATIKWDEKNWRWESTGCISTRYLIKAR
jgi:hypothetical protein